MDNDALQEVLEKELRFTEHLADLVIKNMEQINSLHHENVELKIRVENLEEKTNERK